VVLGQKVDRSVSGEGPEAGTSEFTVENSGSMKNREILDQLKTC
jgi:hypothetical protein